MQRTPRRSTREQPPVSVSVTDRGFPAPRLDESPHQSIDGLRNFYLFTAQKQPQPTVRVGDVIDGQLHDSAGGLAVQQYQQAGDTVDRGECLVVQ